MSTRPRPAATDCLTRKWFIASPPEKAALAEYTITRPKNISRTTVVKSTLSKASFFAMRRPSVVFPSQLALDQLLEDLAAVDEVLELVEAGAGRREHDGLAGPGLVRGRAHGPLQGLRAL